MLDDVSPPSAEAPRSVRCAIYARVSVADAERPSLTSIQVQVEACEQYIAARRGMGWIQSGPAYIEVGCKS